MNTTTMQAAVTTRWGKLELQSLAIPEPGPGQVRVRTTLAGICGSDLHIFQGHHPTAVSPIVQGHEFVGIVDAVGPDVPDEGETQVGRRVVVEPLISCGQCEACRRGLVHVCRKLKLLGIHEAGAFGEYFLAPAKKVIAVPDGLADALAALTEPFAVGMHVCRQGGVQTGDRALVVGAGPIGLIVAMVAQTAGAEVAVSEISEARLKQAAAFGFATIDARQDAAEQARERTDGDGFDVVFEVSGSEPGVALAIEAARVRGRLVQVGFFGKPPVADLFKLTLKELSLVGSRVYTEEDFRRTVRLLEQIVEKKRFDLEQLISGQTDLAGLEAAIGRMLAGEVSGKILVQPSNA
ncbi:zinc-binding dehydrogenase [Phycisphaerales bacterium AB-hyl4]|uniref:Zinc-binding dehydrogenase n=1 Tax=Natronomicrosphaera hydrolytica TaxID=3242702 RepID=A0ABV4UBZ7_9BACT